MENPINYEASQELALVVRPALVRMLASDFVPASGICANLEFTVESVFAAHGYNPYVRERWHAVYQWLEQGFESWPNFSGDHSYPVPASAASLHLPAEERQILARRAFVDAPYQDFFDDTMEYGRLRRNLVEHLITLIDAGVIPKVPA